MKVSDVLRFMRNIVCSATLWVFALLPMGVAISSANAGVIERVEIKRAGEEAEIRILFVTQIQYLREGSLKSGDIRIYFNLLGLDATDPRLVPENKESPPSDIAPHFSISYPELDSSLSVSFGKVVDYHVRAGKDGRSISIFTPALKPKNGPESSAATAIVAPTAAITPPLSIPSVTLPSVQLAAPRPVAEIELEAQQLIGSARYALQNDRPEAAIESLNKLLNLPPNQQSQPAQKLIGEAWEKHGEFDKARVEYELYIKLYPDAADIKQVNERLARLPAKGTTKPVQAAVVAKPKFVEEKMVVYGGLSQYFYKGISHTDSLIISGATSTTSSLTRQDQSQLLSMLDVTGRKRTETTDTRMVFRDNYNANFLPGQVSSNRFDAAYIEQSARDHSYMYRVGRQTGSGGGAPGRFDGVVAGYSFNPTWRVNGVVGKPVEFTSGGLGSGPSKDFAGMSVDLTRLPEQWSSSGYLIQQRVDGLVDRRAVGVDAHYFDAQRNFMGLFEFDTIFRDVNLAMLQGNWTVENDSYNVLVDHRRSPPLQLTNALMGQPIQSVATLLQSGVSMDTIRADAKALSPTSNMFAIGMNRLYSPRLRLGGDFRVSNMSGTGATSTGQQATEGSGNTYSYSIQATGNNLLLENDYGVVNATYTSSKTYTGQSLAFTQVETLRQYWRIDMLLLLYNQVDDFGTHTTQIRPSLKLNYRWNDSVNLEGEGGIEQIHTSSAIQDDKTQRKYFYIGYRWDFR